MSIKISVIVTIYNIKEYLKKCLDSIINQSYSNLQIILVDDGSTDGSEIVADQYTLKDSRIEVVHKKNGGVVAARKTGVQVAKGEYIYFIDGDDWIEKNTLKNMMNYFSEESIDAILPGYKEDFQGKSLPKLNRIPKGIYYGEHLIKEIFPYLLCNKDFYSMNIYPYLCGKLIRRELLIQHIMDVDERIRIGEDVAVIVPVLVSSKKIIIIEECGYHYCIRFSSMLQTTEDLSVEKEKLQILHNYLNNKDWMYEKGFSKEQLYKFTMNNILTRIYSSVGRIYPEFDLWPFVSMTKCNSIIIYGAGNFGRAVYSYIQNQTETKEMLWVDRRYEEYQAVQLPVENPESVEQYRERDIIITILDQEAVDSIFKFLVSKGFPTDRIHRVDLDTKEIVDVLIRLQFEK